ncbi:hypothetical protein D9619_008559 [Psilocybe cf. subviscida]|uniref:Cation efflux protein n=1 Tax=Psilocybe cf. subviscida TaxID=2480587 RepID=A0A8H5B9P9_9AGAR|nr:hypothetical protein D9619_008559 [Psilocybe cf. subviscida]
MGLSRVQRITILLVIDLAFFFVELIAGYAVGSLALVADSFHMLNDVVSLVIALYAIKLTKGDATDPRYSYGWHRAEILAALVNGVFLLALCFSISLEAIGRFFTAPEISSPKFVAIVGSLGLASNIVGLFLFHEHGHSHSHDQKKSSRPASIASTASRGSLTRGVATPKQKSIPIHRGRSSSRTRTQITQTPSDSSYSSLYGHPAATRASLVQTAADIAFARSPSPTRATQGLLSIDEVSSPAIPATTGKPGPHTAQPSAPLAITFNENTPLLNDSPTDHRRANGGGHGHSHGGSMNMHALLLHVLGDALGNVGVILTGLIIWKTTWEYKYYCDPVISLIITIIIFSSALPLVRSTSFILLQGVPATVSLEEVKDSILNVEGVLSLHELHVWQLSENKLVASVHVLASRSHDFMPVAVKIRKVLHHLGIHSCTIQPEYYHSSTTTRDEIIRASEDSSCLILCPPDAECNPEENACCPPPPPAGV